MKRPMVFVSILSLFLVLSATFSYAADKKALAAQDEKFMTEAANGGAMEVELGKFAQKTAQSQDVKDFGTRMASDHGKANDELKAIAQQKKVKVVSMSTGKFKAVVTSLSKLTGGDFDKKYMYEMVKDHTEDLAKFQSASREVKDTDIKNWVDKTLPTLQLHSQQAKDIAQKLGVDVNKAEKEGKSAAEKK